MGNDEALAQLQLNTIEGEPDADVLGYRYLAALRKSDEEMMANLKEQMSTIVLDARAKAWLEFIAGESAFRAESIVEARTSVQKAIDTYTSEPTFHLLMGAIQQKQGRFNEAIELWTQSSEAANDKVGSSTLSNSSGWTVPMIRILDAYSAQRRLAEAVVYIRELGRIGQRDVQATFKLLEVKATLARSGELPDEMGEEFLATWTKNKEEIPPESRALLAPMVATILASSGYWDQAHDELLSAVEHAKNEPKLLIDIVDVDARYQLGVAADAGIDTRSIGAESVEGALRIANRVARDQQSTEAGLRLFDQAMAKAPEQSRDAWNRARVGFLDARDDPRAGAGWEELLAANPKDVDLRYRAAESNAFSKDLARVDALIAEITQINDTPGKTPESRLRLARANAIVGTVRNRTNRDRALEIVRSVVATEPNNIKARNMLGKLQVLQPSPGLPENEQYKRDFQGAIDSYLVLANQLGSQGAQTYLLESSDLAFEMGDEEQASEILRQLSTRFERDWRVLPLVAERYENLGKLQQAADIYRRVIQNNPTSDAALAFANLQLKLGNTTQGMSMIQQISKAETLTQDQLLRLASLYVRAGKQPEAELIASSGERYGLDPFEAKMLMARFARAHLSPEAQILALQEATEIDPQNSLGWRQLIQRLIELNRFKEARAVYEQAISAIPNDDDIERLDVLTRGTPVTGEDLLQMSGIKDNDHLQDAIKQVDVYDKLPRDATIQERVEMLTGLINDYPEIPAVQTYAVNQLRGLPIDPGFIAFHAEKALKNARGNAQIMAIAGESALLSNQPEQAIRVVQLWRANSLESSIIAEAIMARAMIQLGRYQQAAERLNSYIETATQTPDEPLHIEILDAFCYARLMIGENPEVTAARLEPLMQSSASVRNRIWLGLAANAIQDPSIGAAWISRASEYADLDDDADRFAIAQAWIRLAERHQSWNADDAQRAIELLTPLVERDAKQVTWLRVIATAYAQRARAQQGQQQRRDDYARAVEFMLQAADLDEGNLGPLLDAAGLSVEGDLHKQARLIYERLLGYPIPEGELKAMLLNNLSMSILREGVGSADADQLMGYVEESTRLSPTTPTFWGTRGWVEHALGDTTGAERSFRTLIGYSPDDAEGWTGLAIVLQAQGASRADELAAALAKLRQINERSPLEPELRQHLTASGLSVWDKSGSP